MEASISRAVYDKTQKITSSPAESLFPESTNGKLLEPGNQNQESPSCSMYAEATTQSLNCKKPLPLPSRSNRQQPQARKP
eukprot:scaffold382027_cov15-Prasinocladus_malaysianus.AAC.1